MTLCSSFHQFSSQVGFDYGDMLYHDLAFGRHLGLGRIHGHRGLVRFFNSVLSVLWPPSWNRKNSQAPQIGKIQRFCTLCTLAAILA